MEKILEKTHELGRLIAESKELSNYQSQEIIFAADPEAQKMAQQYEEKSMALAQEMQSKEMTPENLETFRIRMNEIMAELTQNENAKNYLEAKSAFNNLIMQVNEIIGYHVRGGEEAGGCSGECSCCSGCH